jgi:hypothetical protein
LIGYLHPDVVWVEGIPVPIEGLQITLACCTGGIHRSVLLMAEDNRFGRSTFSVGFEAL